MGDPPQPTASTAQSTQAYDHVRPSDSASAGTRPPAPKPGPGRPSALDPGALACTPSDQGLRGGSFCFSCTGPEGPAGPVPVSSLLRRAAEEDTASSDHAWSAHTIAPCDVSSGTLAFRPTPHRAPRPTSAEVTTFSSTAAPAADPAPHPARGPTLRDPQNRERPLAPVTLLCAAAVAVPSPVSGSGESERASLPSPIPHVALSPPPAPRPCPQCEKLGALVRQTHYDNLATQQEHQVTVRGSSIISRSAVSMEVKPMVVGIAADSGCGKSTFMRRLTSIFGGESKLLDIGRETNTLVSDMTTVICLDDYHKWDRTGRKSNPEWPDGITALHADCQLWDKMAADVTDLKAGKTVEKPIYNHITGELDPDETVSPTPIVIFEGLHPLYDERVVEALDLSVYLDITDDVKFAWKAQRDIAERGATMEDVQAAIDARKPDFAAYVEPQKQKADIVVQVLLSDLIDDPTGKFLKVKLIHKKGLTVSPAYFFDEGASIEWTPNPSKLTTSAPGVKIASYDDEWFGTPVQVIEMDGKMDELEEMVYIESHLCNAGTKYYGELSEQILANKDSPGSDNGTGLFQTVCSFKIREAYEALKK